ncbi:beta-glucoside operon transcriptional antiterminator [Arthrobacter bambusae]|uniref:Beta-glucoside operon transcriptional antiterminator n=1 Tax=Arthrobacter bambusae TaxID=1338426 RepID=A0ABV2P1A3_9MICC
MPESNRPGPTEFTIVRAYNNNVAEAKDDAGRDYVLMGRGIGFNASRRPRIAAADVDRTFRPTDGEGTERFAALLAELPNEHLETAALVAQLVRDRLDADVSDSFLIGIADHITTAIERVRSGYELDIPLVAEMPYAFPTETGIAREVLQVIRSRTHVKLPDEETAALALHIVNARFSTAEMPTAFKLAKVLHDSLQIVRDAFDVDLDPTSVSVARFATHLRYLITRLQAASQHEDASEFLWNAAKTAHPDEHSCAVHVGNVLSQATGLPIRREEELYLTLHVLRLTTNG